MEKSDSQKLLDLLKQDIAEASPQELIGIPCGQMELYATSYADMDEHIAPESYAEVGRYIFPTFKRTLVFLKERLCFCYGKRKSETVRLFSDI